MAAMKLDFPELFSPIKIVVSSRKTLTSTSDRKLLILTSVILMPEDKHFLQISCDVPLGRIYQPAFEEIVELMVSERMVKNFSKSSFRAAS